MNLTELARKTLEAHFKGRKFEPGKETKKKFSEKKACFVTLTKDGELRGCIGSLEARQELWKDVQENIINSAFKDFRFLPLTKEELDKIKIEISVLNKPKKLEFADEEDLLKKINKKMGLVLKKGFNSATFLPQVWESILDKIIFLEQLCSKAGLEKDAWKNAEILHYGVEKEKE